MKTYCLLITIVLLSSCAARKAFNAAMQNNSIEVGLYNNAPIKRDSEKRAKKDYINLSSDDSLRAAFNNALGYHLQQRGFKVSNIIKTPTQLLL